MKVVLTGRMTKCKVMRTQTMTTSSMPEDRKMFTANSVQLDR